MKVANNSSVAEQYEPDLDAAASAAEESAGLSAANNSEAVRPSIRRPLSSNTMRAPIPRPSVSAAPTTSVTNQDSKREKPATNNKAVLSVGPGLNVEGKITNCEDLSIEGTAVLAAEASNLFVSRSGRLSGEVFVKDAEIEGHFEGHLEVSGTLIIRASGVIKGELSYGRLKVDEGGRIIGELKLGDQSDTKINRRAAKANISVAE